MAKKKRLPLISNRLRIKLVRRQIEVMKCEGTFGKKLEWLEQFSKTAGKKTGIFYEVIQTAIQDLGKPPRKQRIPDADKVLEGVLVGLSAAVLKKRIVKKEEDEQEQSILLSGVSKNQYLAYHHSILQAALTKVFTDLME